MPQMSARSDLGRNVGGVKMNIINKIKEAKTPIDLYRLKDEIILALKDCKKKKKDVIE